MAKMSAQVDRASIRLRPIRGQTRRLTRGELTTEMCGLIGVGGPEGGELVARLVGDLSHRGPDDEGKWSNPELALGHRRLTIIGLDRDGQQPMWSRSGESVIVFNGEIYNYLELADELESRGRPSDRRFDTTVLLEALELWGVDALPKFNGMFAFAWYRPQDKSLLLARDRWGKKPLFWGTYPSADGRRYVALSSELRTFARLPGGPPDPDPLGIARYMAYDGMPGERTVYHGVSKVPAASWLQLDPTGRVERRGVFWRFEPCIEPVDAEEAGERLVELLSRSLELRLRSDVPVGLFLSGGMDSSILASVWRRQRPLQVLGFRRQRRPELPGSCAVVQLPDPVRDSIPRAGADAQRVRALRTARLP